MAADIVVAAEHARFGLPEPRVGFAALGGGAHRLPLRMPYHMAMGLLLTGRQIDAAEAHRWGLVNSVVPADKLMDVARQWAEEMLQCSPLALRYTKMAANAANEPAALRQEVEPLEQALGARLAEHADTREGLAAFAEKRKPLWTGR